MPQITLTFAPGQITDGVAGGGTGDNVLVAGGVTFTIAAAGNWTANFIGDRLNFSEDPAVGGGLFTITVSMLGAEIDLADYTVSVSMSPAFVGSNPASLFINHRGGTSSYADNSLGGGPYTYSAIFPGAPPAINRNSSLQIYDQNIFNESYSGRATIWLDNIVVDYNVVPTIANFESAVTYQPGSGVKVLDAAPLATVTDPDGSGWDTGRVRLSITNRVNNEDALGLQNEGTGAGQVGVSGTNVTYSGVVVGTLSGGGPTSSNITVTLNANATTAAVQAIIHNLTYTNSNVSATGTRGLNLSVRDALGDDSLTSTATLSFAVTNTAPTLGVNAGSTVAEGGTDIITAAELDFNDAEQADSAITYTVTSAATNGALRNNGVNLGVGGTFTQADIGAGLLTYVHNGSETTAASFGFSVSDGAGGTVAGQTFNFSITAVDDAPTLSPANPVASYTENGLAAVLSSSFSLADPDTATFTGATVLLTDPVAGDLLSGGAVGPFSSAYNLATHTLTISGSGTLSQLEAALRTVAFSSSSENPTVGGLDASRTVTVTALNGGSNGVSNSVSVQINLTAVNDAPLAVIDGTVYGGAPGTPLNLKGQLSVSDVDAGAGSVTVTLSVTHGVLTVAAGTSGAGVTGSPGSSVTLTGTLAQINALLNTDATSSVSFNDPAPTGPITLTLAISDNGNTGGGALSAQDTASIVLNEPPVAAPASGSGAEDQSGRIAIVLSATDAESDAITGFNIASLPTGGQLYAAATGGSALALGATVAASGGAATVWFQPTADFNGSPSFTYTASDANGAGPAATASITVSAVVDIADDVASVVEDTPTTILVLANDTFENPGRAITAVTQGLHGTVAINTNGTVGDASDDFIVYTPGANYAGPDTFSYTITSGGVTEQASVAVTVTAVDDPPAFAGLDNAPTYVEDGGRIVLDADASVSDVDTPSFDGSTLTLSRVGGADADDSFGDSGSLELTDGQVYLQEGGPNGPVIVGGYVNEGGTLAITFNADATQGRVDAVLRQISYANSSQSPSGTATIGYVFDNGLTATGSVAVTLVATNDPPDLEGVTASVNYAPGGPAAPIGPGVMVSDVDSATLTGASVTIVNVQAGDLLSADAGATGLAVGYAGGVLTLSGTATLAQYQQVLATVAFSSSSSDPQPRIISWQVSDGTDLSQPQTTNLYYAPTVDLDASAAGTGYSTGFTENGAGVPIADVDVLVTAGSYGLTSATVVLTGAQVGDALTVGSLPGAITAVTDVSVPGQITVTLNGLASAADYAAALRAISFSAAGEDPSSAARQVSVTLSDGNAVSNIALAAVAVTSVNDAPSGTDGSATFQEDGFHILTLANFGFSDVDGDAFAAVVIASLPGVGALTLSGAPVSAGQVIAATAIAAGQLRYTPPVDTFGSPLASFTFRVRDDGGTANGGIDTDPSANSFAFNVIDNTPPLLVSTSPADEQGNIAPQANLVLTFNEAVKAGSGALQLYEVVNKTTAVLVTTILVTDVNQVSFSGSTMTVDPTANLQPGREYYLTFGSGVVVDLAGNAFAGLSSTQMNFFTAAPDTAAPVLVSSSPADDATGVNPAANLVLTFNEQVQAGTGSFEIWKLDPKFGAVLFRTIAAGDATQVSVSGASVTLNPTVDLDPSSSYYVNFTAGAVRDLAGNNAAALTSQSAYNFSTGLAAPLPTLAIGPANITLAEGNGGTTAYSFTVTRTGDTSGATTANWAVTGSSANPANAADFGGTLPSGVVSFVAGQTTATLTVNVAGDTAFEPTEGFTVTLSGASGSAVIATASATGTITNDDAGPPSLAIGPANLAQNEGNAGTTAFTFTVTRSGDVSGTSSANWAVSGSSGNAANVFDFATAEVFPSGTVTFAAGATTATIVVNVLGDTAFEPTEGFTVTLSSPSAGTTISTASATGTIVNDDTNPSDTTAPLLVSSSPADEQGNIAPQANLVLTFNEAVQAGSGVLQIYDNTDRFAAPVLVRTISVTDAGQVSFSGSTLTINPTADLSPSRAYYLTFGSGVVVDLAGNAFAGLSSTQMNFFTAAPDTAAPVLVSSSPADDATGVNPAANLVLTFNEQVQAGTGSFEIWKLDPKFGAVLFRTIAAGDATQVSVSGASVTLNPTVDLDPSSSYYVNFTAGAVRDLAGNNAAALTSQSAYNFSTGSGVVVVFHESFAAPAFSDDAYSAPLIGTPDDTPPTMDWTGILWG